MKIKEFIHCSPEQLSGTAKTADKALQESLRSDGQLFPLLICGNKAPFSVIDGHKRLAVLQELNQPIECLRLTESEVRNEAEEEIRMNAHRGLTMLEKSALLKKLIQQGLSHEEILNDFLKKLKLPQEKRVLENLLSIKELSEEEKAFFSAKNFGEYLLTLIFNLEPEERSAFLRFSSQYGLNHNQGRDILEKLQQARQKKPVADVLFPWFLRLQEEPEKAGILLKRFILELDVLCNEGSETWQKLQELKKNLPKSSTLDEKEYLKNGVVTLTVRMRNSKDVENLSNSLKNFKI